MKYSRPSGRRQKDNDVTYDRRRPRGAYNLSRLTEHSSSDRMADELPPWVDPPLAIMPPRPVFTAFSAAPSPIKAAPARTCQWLEGDARALNWCGVKVAWPGCSWCHEHEKIVYVRGRAA